MCVDPISLAAIGGGAAGGGAALGGITSLLGTGLSIFGSIQQGKAAQAQADYQSKQSLILKEDAIRRGAETEQRQRRQNAALEGRQRAVLASSGVDANSGSPLEILADTAQIGELDVRNIRSNTSREAASHQQASDIAEFEGENAKRASYIDAFGTALGGISSVSSKWATAFPSSGNIGGTTDSRIGALF